MLRLCWVVLCKLNTDRIKKQRVWWHASRIVVTVLFGLIRERLEGSELITTDEQGEKFRNSPDLMKCRGSSVGTVTRLQIDERCVFKPSRPALGLPSLPFCGYRGSFPGLERPGLEANHSPPSNVNVKSGWSYTAYPSIGLHGVDRENVLLYIRPGTSSTFTHIVAFRPDVAGFSTRCMLDKSHYYLQQSTCRWSTTDGWRI
jgi:hypothetical protein